MSHTPEKWQSDGDLVFYQKNPGGVKLSIAYMSRELPVATVKANTRIVVAAPSLLSALQRLTDESLRFDWEPDCAFQIAFEQARAALAKANGSEVKE